MNVSGVRSPIRRNFAPGSSAAKSSSNRAAPIASSRRTGPAPVLAIDAPRFINSATIDRRPTFDRAARSRRRHAHAVRAAFHPTARIKRSRRFRRRSARSRNALGTRFRGGWHEFWDALRDHLDGVPAGSRLPARFQALAAAFAQNGVRGGLFDAKGVRVSYVSFAVRNAGTN